MMRFVSYRFALATFAALLGLFDSPQNAASSEFRTVVITGQPAVGTPGFTFARPIESFQLNDAGQVAFLAEVQNGPSLAGRGIWLDTNGTQSQIARTQTAAPGTTANFFDVRNGLALNSLGRVAFGGNIDASSATDTGIWSDIAGSLQLQVREGDPAPNIPQRSLGQMPQLSLGDDGQVAFSSFLSGPSLVNAVFKGNAQGLSLVAQGETQAPGTEPGATFVSRASFILTRNKPGDLLFSATLTGPSITSAIGVGLWSDRTGALALVLRSGDPAPEIGSQTTITGFSTPAMNDLAHIAVPVGLAGPGVNATNNTGILLDKIGSTQLMVRKGDAAPGADPGTVFTNFESPIALNNFGKIAFGANVSGPNPVGLWSGKPGDLRLVAQLGDPAPGVSGGATFGSMVQEGFPILHTLNDRGQTAFMAQLTGPGITATNDLGIWATDTDGMLHLIAREGDEIEVAPNDFRVVTELLVREFQTNKSVILNNRGQIAFDARLDDGTGIFISNAVAVPEPTTALLMLSVMFLLLRFRRLNSTR